MSTATNTYPGLGGHVTADFSPVVVFDLDFTVPGKMTFMGTDGMYKGYTDTVVPTFVEVAPNVFMVYWQEENGIAVVHVQNWNTHKVWTNIFTPGEKEVAHLEGTLSLARLSNADKAARLLKAIETGETEPIAFINPDKYRQHNLAVADGLDGFGAAVAALKDFPEKARMNTVRVFDDGDFVVLHSSLNFFGEKIGFDIFRFEDGKIVEHWDNLQDAPASANPSGHTMIDGATEITDLEKTAENKAIAGNFVKDVLMGQHPERISDYIDGANYTQHNPAIADGLDGLGAALATMAEQGIEMKYDTLHKVLGKGNFVLTISEGFFGGVHTSYYDLFRIENGKIVEHWDTVESILPEDKRLNKNGKYGF